MIYELAGYLSGIAIILSFFPYIRDIFLKKTKPERASWLIWGILGSIAFFSQLAEGASYSLIMTGVQTFGDLLIFVLAIKYGIGGFLKRDIASLIAVAFSLFLWYTTKEAAIALFIVIFVDAIGAILTIIKTYEKPTTETISSWVFTFFGGFLACVAVGSLNYILLAFPFYICVASAGILIAIKMGLRRDYKVV